MSSLSVPPYCYTEVKLMHHSLIEWVPIIFLLLILLTVDFNLIFEIFIFFGTLSHIIIFPKEPFLKLLMSLLIYNFAFSNLSE